MDKERDLLDSVFSWSLEDIFNEDLFKSQVEKIPQSFESVQNYLGSFVSPLLEEIRAELSSTMEAISSAPFAQIISLNEYKPYPTASLLYDVEVGYWRNGGSSHHGKEPYRALPSDIFVFTQAMPESVSDLQRSGSEWAFGTITKISGGDNKRNDIAAATHFNVKASKDLININDGRKCKSYMIFLMNITTSKRIWTALHKAGNVEVIKRLLCTETLVEEICNLCPIERNQILEEKLLCLSSELNESQYEAVVSSVRKMQCDHKSNSELIWGPPGTGKTRTLSMLLCTLIRLKCRTLICAPTNVAITEVASRTLKVMRESLQTGCGKDDLFFPLGDILLFGNKEKLKLTPDLQEVYLDYRVEKLAECFGSVSGWKDCFTSMIEFLEGCVSQYEAFCVDQSINEKCCKGSEDRNVMSKSFLQFLRDQFGSSAVPLRRCVSALCTHLPLNFIQEFNFHSMVSLVDSLDSLEKLLDQKDTSFEKLRELFAESESVDASECSVLYFRRKCISALRTIHCSLDELKLPSDMNKDSVVNFCFQKTSLILCTVSNSYKLHSVEMEPLRLLVIDEAAQIKECDSIIPLTLPGIKHIILFGDECQLPAMVRSNVSQEAGFGRSLFERLTLSGHSKQLLNIQYRMHPSISCFPNSKFYQNKVMDSANVKSQKYTKCFLRGPMFGPFSFINISCGREMLDDQRSRKNMVEVAVVLKILHLLSEACAASKKKLSVGIVSPYSAQIAEIQHRLGRKYEKHDNFVVNVKSIDGCQGGEEDVVVISTVRSSGRGSNIGFISSPRRTNVALTRARHCLWILGNETTLSNSGSVWDELISDAKVRQCFFNADEHKDFEKVIIEVKKELDELDDFLNGNSIMFKSARWKVFFSDNFRKSFVKLKSPEMKNLVLILITKLSTGWRPKRRNLDINCEDLSQMLNKFKVRELYIVCSIDIVEESWYTQVLKVWDVLPLEEFPKLVKRLDGIFGMYTDDYLNRCKVKCHDGDFEVPMTWTLSSGLIQYKNLSETKNGKALINDASLVGKGYVEDTKVSESLLLMKFYSLSIGAVSHLLSGCNGKELSLPFELTNQEKEIIHFNRSTFILGRSGTGKTTVLTMKLFQNEQLYHLASEGYHQVQSNLSTDDSWRHQEDRSETDQILEAKRDILHQIFVTVSPKLCFAVKQHVSQLKSFVCGSKSSAKSSSVRMDDDIDDALQFADIPDSFVDILPESYPLIITFSKFLMMLDGTVGTSYFEKFRDARQLAHGKSGNARSLAFQIFIRTKEVTFERFSSSYWSHFNILLTKKLVPSIVFTEIMSVIKGGLIAGEVCDGKVSRQDYVSLSECRVGSSISRQKREMIYDIFLAYEKKKAVNGEFDFADLVIDLHHRLRNERYAGDEIHFVFVDEVQDLSMKQIALFKYVCRNFSEGFVFSGDTAQTIAKGIDFRFEDIRCLFYVEFLGLKRDETDGRKGKGQISDMFYLTHNFRTHDGVLKLAQSVIDLLYYFFPQSIDVLTPESSLIYGEAPTIIVPNHNENAVLTIFQNSGKDFAGFGAEQVVLVRDDSSRREISDYIGKQALVLTIMECKGLEFQDVLLYNFFSSSPMRNHWEVIYEYMVEKDLQISTSPQHFQGFNLEKHTALCSELKQLYVAITRTRQRLWICEDEGFSDSVFNYWMKLNLVKVRKLDYESVKEMQIVSSQEEWKSRGIKLFYEHNYEMAMMCFERAGDTYWESYAKAAALRATSEHMHFSDPKASHIALKKAAEILDSIDKFELAAQCYFELNEFERAGKIYLEKCGESKLENAGFCFSLARQYKLAADAYAKANLYEQCLSACSAGRLFDIGLRYIRRWKQHADQKIDKIGQDFLQGAALHYYELKKNWLMMNFVKFFFSVNLMRTFLKNLNCLNELLLLEKEWGNFLEAANLARLIGDDPLEADMLEKAGKFREASMLLLWYVFVNSMHRLESKLSGTIKRWFTRKEQLLGKAKSIAVKHSNLFYEFVCREAKILLSGKTIDELPSMGLQFIRCWKEDAPTDVDRAKTSYEIENVEQNLLDRCAHYYHWLKDKKTMMKYVKDFHSIDLMRTFLKDLSCFDELLLLEEEYGNYLEAANMAAQKGDLVRQADLLEKAGHFKEASKLFLWNVLPCSLWSSRSRGWPLMQFRQKEELLTRAKSCAQNHSDDLFHEFVSIEANILSNRESSMSELREYLIASHRHKSLRGEILSVWKILDAHLNSDTSIYDWSNVLVKDMRKHSEEMISHNKISIETLVYFWNFWNKKIVDLIDCLLSIGRHGVSENMSYEDFCLNYMGARKLNGNRSTIYQLLNSEAIWFQEINYRSIERNGNTISIGVREFVSAALSYWRSELFSVGLTVLETLKALYDYSFNNTFSVFNQSMSLLHVFEVVKFLKEYKFQDCRYNSEIVDKYLTLSVQNYFGHVFPLDSRKSLTLNMVLLRGTNLSMSLINEAIFGNISTSSRLTYGQMGMVAMMILGSGKLFIESYSKIVTCFGGNSKWMTFVEELILAQSEVALGSEMADVALREVSLVNKFYEALEDACLANPMSEQGYMSPACFLYLVERLLFMVSYFQGLNFFTTKASAVEWLIFQEWTINPNANLVNDLKFSLDLGHINDLMANVVHEMILNKYDTMEWIRSTTNYLDLEDYYPLLVLRLIVLLCILCVNSGKHFDKLFTLLGRRDISSQLPCAFCDAILRKECYFVDALAEALKKIDNPLVVVGVGENFSKFSCSDAYFVNLSINKCGEDVVRELFPEEEKSCSNSVRVGVVGEMDSTTPFSDNSYGLFWKTFHAVDLENEKGGNIMSLVSTAPKIKVEVQKYFQLLSAAIDSFPNNTCDDDGNLLPDARSKLDDLNQLFIALDMSLSGRELEEDNDDVSAIGELLKRLQLRRARVEPFLNQSCLPN
ncbi:hypothetical protein ACSBR1_004309 [Camellia fascicularis]